VPDCTSLIELCDLLSIRTDYVLLGDGVASRSQSREQANLEQDISAHLSESLTSEGFGHWPASDVNGRSILSDAVAAAKHEPAYYSRLLEMAPARIVAHHGLLLDLIGQVAR
jgi:hypothetical protein